MKYFTKEVKIALTAIVAIILLFIGLNFLKGINVFQSTQTFYVKFKDINGLVVSNSVFANGYPVGIVRTIDYDYERGEHVVVGIEVDDDMRIPNGTRAELEAELKKRVEGITSLVIDIEKLEYISSAGLRVLLSAHKIMAKQGTMVIKNVRDEVREIFEVTGFDEILNIE